MLRPELVDAPDDIKFPLARSGGIAPKFFLSDDIFYSFNSPTGMFPVLYVDDGIPLAPITSLDGPSERVILSNQNLTAAHANTSNYCGARSTLLKQTGKYYFEVSVGATHGLVDCAGVIHESGTYHDLANFRNATAAYSQYPDGPVATDFTRYGSLGEWAGGDIIGAAIDLDNQRAWFRKKNASGIGTWNGDPSGHDPETVTGGAPLIGGRVSPVLGFGGQAGVTFTGNPATT